MYLFDKDALWSNEWKAIRISEMGRQKDQWWIADSGTLGVSSK
jgi:hypothetical protein